MAKWVLRDPFYSRIALVSGLIYGLFFLFASGTIFFANGGPFPTEPFFLAYVDPNLGPGIVWLVTRTLLVSATLANGVTIVALSFLVGLNVALGVYSIRTNRQSTGRSGGLLPGAVLGLFSTASCCVPSTATWFVNIGLVSVANFFYSYYYVTAIGSVVALLGTASFLAPRISDCKSACTTQR